MGAPQHPTSLLVDAPLPKPWLALQPHSTHHGGHFKQQKLYCNNTEKPRNTSQSIRGVRGDEEAQIRAVGSSGSHWEPLHTGCKLLSS